MRGALGIPGGKAALEANAQARSRGGTARPPKGARARCVPRGIRGAAPGPGILRNILNYLKYLGRPAQRIGNLRLKFILKYFEVPLLGFEVFCSILKHFEVF